MPALYFDISDTVTQAMRHSTVTGIPRSVLKIIEGAVRDNLGFAVHGLVKHPVSGRFIVADLSFMRGHYEITDFCSRFDLPPGRATWLSDRLDKYKTKRLKRSFHQIRLLLQWYLSNKARDHLAMRSGERKESCLRDDSIMSGSVIVSLGAGWLCDYQGVYALAAVHGCKTVSFVHDIFPVFPPGETAIPDRKSDRFRDWLKFVAENASLLVCISQFTKQQLGMYFGTDVPKAPITVIPFPHEFQPSGAKQTYSVRPQINEIIKTSYVLCVGTGQIRKNVISLLEAWRELRDHDTRRLPRLILAGGKGCDVAHVRAILRKTSNIGGTVTIVDSPNDGELELLYGNCQFSVFPSKFEGWGLPIGESLWFGKPVICASNASMPEVGGVFATYFDHGKPGSLLAALKGMIDAPVKLPDDIRQHLTTWSETSAALCKVIAALGGDRSSAGEHSSAGNSISAWTRSDPLSSSFDPATSQACAPTP